MARIVSADETQLSELIPLFDQYRIFYRQKSDLEAATAYLQMRLKRKEAIIYLAIDKGKAIGFTLLYKGFSSVSMQPILILNDLYVAKPYRNKGVGEQLLKTAQVFCQENNYKGLALETATDNPAQRLYERLGWKKDSYCFHYFWNAG